ncbi:MAG: polysaccharide deacetylase family protein [Anaerolineae bacterium]|nr:polysaccharide deacetylase family protein [Anaerolineae bacterium]
MPPLWITTSWDDGHRLDQRIAALLDRFGMKGTFYIARNFLDRADRLTEAEIARLAESHEIGAHTFTHPDLAQVDHETAYHEIVGSRDWLESVIGAPVTAFCYPKGRYTTGVHTIVSEAGFDVARTVQGYFYETSDIMRDPLAMPATIHVYPFPFRPVDSLRARFDPLRLIWPRLRFLNIRLTALRSWGTLALALLDRAAACGGVWHLWGHSWEVERYGMWENLEHVLSAAAQYPDARFVTNTELARALIRRKP